MIERPKRIGRVSFSFITISPLLRVLEDSS
jgi:hypothetical protein